MDGVSFNSNNEDDTSNCFSDSEYISDTSLIGAFCKESSTSNGEVLSLSLNRYKSFMLQFTPQT